MASRSVVVAESTATKGPEHCCCVRAAMVQNSCFLLQPTFGTAIGWCPVLCLLHAFNWRQVPWIAAAASS